MVKEVEHLLEHPYREVCSLPCAQFPWSVDLPVVIERWPKQSASLLFHPVNNRGRFCEFLPGEVSSPFGQIAELYLIVHKKEEWAVWGYQGFYVFNCCNQPFLVDVENVELSPNFTVVVLSIPLPSSNCCLRKTHPVSLKRGRPYPHLFCKKLI